MLIQNVGMPPGGMYGARGRYGKWILSDRGGLWNYATKDWICVMTYPVTDYSDSLKCVASGKYARLSGQFAYTVDGNMDKFVRYDVSKGTGVSVSLNSFGISCEELPDLQKYSHGRDS